MRKLYRTDKQPIIANKKMSKKQMRELREIVEQTPPSAIVPIDPEEWPEDGSQPVKDADDGG